MVIKTFNDLKSDEYKSLKKVKSVLDTALAGYDLKSQVIWTSEYVVGVLHSYKKEGTPYSDTFNLICERNLPYFEKLCSEYKIWLSDLNDLGMTKDIKPTIEYIHHNYLMLPEIIGSNQIHPNVKMTTLNRIDNLCKEFSIVMLGRAAIIEYLFSRDDLEGLNSKSIKKIHEGNFIHTKESIDKYEAFFNNNKNDFIDANLRIIGFLNRGFTDQSSSKILDYIINLLGVLSKKNKDNLLTDLINKIESFVNDYKDLFIKYDSSNNMIINEIYRKISELK